MELQSAMVDWTTSIHLIYEDAEKEEQERIKRANNALNDFKNFYIVNKLFFSRSFCNYIDEVTSVY